MVHVTNTFLFPTETVTEEEPFINGTQGCITFHWPPEPSPEEQATLLRLSACLIMNAAEGLSRLINGHAFIECLEFFHIDIRDQK